MSILFFTHIPKTAGSSFTQSMIVPNYGKGYLRPSGIRDFSLRSVPKKACIHGHLPFGLHYCKPWRKSTYITFMRDPVKRVISHYYFVLQNPQHPQYQRHLKTPLEHIFEQENGLPISALQANLQTKFIAGFWHGYWRNLNDNQLLSTAKRHIDRYYTFVGLQERYEESCDRLKDLLALENEATPGRKQTTRQKPVVSDAIQSLILSHNSLDLELYEYAEKKYFT